MPIQMGPAPNGSWGNLRGRAGPVRLSHLTQVTLSLCADREQLSSDLCMCRSLHWATLASVCWIDFVYMFSSSISSSRKPSLTEAQFSKPGNPSEFKGGPTTI